MRILSESENKIKSETDGPRVDATCLAHIICWTLAGLYVSKMKLSDGLKASYKEETSQCLELSQFNYLIGVDVKC